MPLSGLDIVIRLAVMSGIVAVPLIFLALRALWRALRRSSSAEVADPVTQFG
jgi:hypothetical protein